MKIAIEITMLVIILLCAWTGYKKGLILCIGTILAIIVSMYMGDLLSDTFSHQAVPVLTPFASGYMEGKGAVIDTEMTELLGEAGSELSVEDAVKQHPEIQYQLCENSYLAMGVYEKPAKEMANEAVALSNKSDGKISASIVQVLCEKLAYTIGFILFFAIVLIILIVIGNVLNLSYKIPGMNRLTDIGGLVAGLTYGIMFCMLLAWSLNFAGMIMPEEEIQSTVLPRLFNHVNFLSKYLSV